MWLPTSGGCLEDLFHTYANGTWLLLYCIAIGMARPTASTALQETLALPSNPLTTERHTLKQIRLDGDLHRLYIERFQAGCKKAASTLVEVNHPFIHNLVIKYGKRHLADYNDLMQEGRIGALEGYARFDLDQKVKPLTYVHWWIRCSIQDFLIQKGVLVRFPGKEFRVGQRRVKTFTEMSKDFRNEDSDTFEETLLFEGPSSDEILSEEQLALFMPHVIEALRETLTVFEFKVLKHRFSGEEGATLKEIGDPFQLSRERIRQILLLVGDKVRRKFPTGNHESFEDWLASAIQSLFPKEEGVDRV